MCSRRQLGRGGHAVEEAPLVERAVGAALAAGAVVGDHDDDRVVELAATTRGSRRPARPGRRCTRRSPANTSAIRMKRRFSSSLSDSHGRTVSSSGQGWPSGPVTPGSPCGLMPLSSVSSGSSPSSFCRARIVVADRLVAVVEGALVLVGPLEEHVVRRVRGIQAEVEEERLVGFDDLGVADELDRLVREVLGDVVALARASPAAPSGGCRGSGRGTSRSTRRRGSRRTARSRGPAASASSTRPCRSPHRG